MSTIKDHLQRIFYSIRLTYHPEGHERSRSLGRAASTPYPEKRISRLLTRIHCYRMLDYPMWVWSGHRRSRMQNPITHSNVNSRGNKTHNQNYPAIRSRRQQAALSAEAQPASKHMQTSFHQDPLRNLFQNVE